MSSAPVQQIEFKLTVGGVILVLVGILCLASAVALLSANLLGPAVVDGALGGVLLWAAFKLRQARIGCPACRKPIRLQASAPLATCGACGHQLMLRRLA